MNARSPPSNGEFTERDCTFVASSEGEFTTTLVGSNKFEPLDTVARRAFSINDVRASNANFGCVAEMSAKASTCKQTLCYHLNFRTFDGTCNNLDEPLRGAAFRRLRRLKEPIYDDEFSAPVCKWRSASGGGRRR